MPKFRPDWSQLNEVVWPKVGTYEGIILSTDEYAREEQVNDNWVLRFVVKLDKCRTRQDGLIELEDGNVVQTHDLRVSLPTTGPNAWLLNRFLRMLGYPDKVEGPVDTNDWHGKRVALKIETRPNRRGDGQIHVVEWLGLLPPNQQGQVSVA